MLASTCRALRRMRDLPCIKVVKGCASGEGTVPSQLGTHAARNAPFTCIKSVKQHMAMHAALNWAAQRWSSARLLQLHLSDSNVAQLTSALDLDSESSDVTALQEVGAAPLSNAFTAGA